MWFTGVMIVIVALVLTFMLVVSNTVVVNDAERRLLQTVQSEAGEVEYTQGVLDINEIDFYESSVYLLVYDADRQLIAGAGRMDFDGDDRFDNAVIRRVESGGASYLVYDLFVPNAQGDLWFRGIISTDSSSSVIRTLVILSVIIFPVLVVIAAVGGWFIANHAFKPVRRITSTVEAISDGSDLTARIGLKTGRDEIHRLAATFDRMFDRLEHSFESEKRFASDASHELRTPTAVIMAECEYARANNRTAEDYQETIEVIERQAGRMSALINQLLGITRMDQGTQRMSIEYANMSELTSIICDEQSLASSKDIALSTDIERDIYASIDVGLMTRLVQNLLQNAYKYTPDGGSVAVSLRRSGESDLALSVRDSGCGIAREDMDRIWDRFWQADQSRGEDSGSGLGLSMVRQIAQAHGGHMSVESAPGAGSTFTFTMPAK